MKTTKTRRIRKCGIVAKFGGTSLATAQNIKRVINIIKADRQRRIIVVSAPGKRFADDIKITDLLLKIYELRIQSKPYYDEYILFATRFLEIARMFKLDAKIAPSLAEFYNQIPFMMIDEITSRGEYFMAKLMAEILNFEFVDIEKTRVLQYKSNTPDYNGFEIDMVASHKNLIKFLGSNIVVPGFYAVTPSGRIRTFSRGGSDITGAIMANMAHASVYENWTDVDGIYTADPNKVKAAKVIESLTYDEAEEIMNAGAQVLHHDVFKFVSNKKIPIYVRNTFNPLAQGTRIN
ncbi:MAG: hypothetical protein FWE16_05505 [Firmicutes bacterium]|nr:hypothetical protein [Bacillota bacterium]